MTGIELDIVSSAGIGPYIKDLRALGEKITYPIDSGDDAFYIDHGPTYHSFFSSMGESWFMIVRRGEHALGTIAAIFREVEIYGKRYPSAYLADFKLDHSVRGGKTARKVALRTLQAAFLEPRFWRWRVGYFAAMQGSRGDVMRSTRRGIHAGAISRTFATVNIYFQSPEALAAIDYDSCPPPPPKHSGINFSPDIENQTHKGWMSTDGRKDLYLASSQSHWPLSHLPEGPQAWQPTYGHYLARSSADILSKAPDSTVCFALDTRLSCHVDWLRSQGVTPGATCKIYGVPLFWPGMLSSSRWVHIATSEI